MHTTYYLARDHLEQAAAILRGNDSRSRQLLHIVERTISLIDDMPRTEPEPPGNVLDFATFKARQGHHR